MAGLILYKANVVTMDPGIPRAELIALERRRILAVGSNDDLPAFRGIKTRLIDCEGGTIVPGFNDAHCHILAFARYCTLLPARAFSLEIDHCRCLGSRLTRPTIIAASLVPIPEKAR